MKLFVLGSSGMLGSVVGAYLKKQGYDVERVSRTGFDALNDSPERWVKKSGISRGDVLINAIGATNAAAPREELDLVNAELPKALDALSAHYGFTLLQPSTDGVFSGARGGYVESDEADAEDPYGRSKREGEKLKNSVVIRTSLIGPEAGRARHFLSWVLSRAGMEVRGYENHTWNGITTLQYAKILEDFLKNGFPPAGLYHVFSPRTVTKKELIAEVARAFGIPITVLPHDAERPIRRDLRTEKELHARLKIPDIRIQLEELAAYCNNH